MKSGAAYLTMEFLEGMSLARRLETRGPMGEGEAAMLLRGVCSALAAAHAKGIVHRDLKPDNIFLTPDPDSAIGERPKLLDFGIAKLTDIGLAGTATKTGAVMGTPTYMSPEQCRGTGDVDARADLYSLGCIFFELVTGRPPFTNLGAGELIGAHLYLDPESPATTRPDLHPETVKLIMSLLRKRPAERPQTAKELGQRLADLAQQLGWITASSPTGVTGQVLVDLALRGQPAATTVDRPMPSMPAPSSIGTDKTTPLFTPGGSAAPSLASLERSLDAEAPVDKPTTLSGAASQVDLSKRSRKGLGIAMAAAALLAGGAVAFFKLNQKTATATPARAPIVEVKKEPPPPPDLPTEAAKAEPPPVEPKVEPAAVEPEEEVDHDKLAKQRKRQQQRRKSAVKPKEPPKKKIETKKVEPPKPPADKKPTPLIERDIE